MSMLRGNDMMNAVNEKDWRLFRSRLPGWQEAFMDKLIVEYIGLLNRGEAASERFWALEKRIREDKRNPGVLITEMSRSKMRTNLTQLLGHGVITLEDLDGFSEELREDLSWIVNSWSADHDN